MKIKDIIAGSKKRKHRDPRKHRMIQKDLYNADPKKLGESKGRDINHLEDLVVFYGSKGGKKAIDVLKSLETSPESVTIKWDGRPAVIFGRNESGEFILTDKSGFGAKTYDGRVTSPEGLEKMLMARPGATKNPVGHKEFVEQMKSIWPAFEAATPPDFRGYVHGDLMYFDTPQKVKDRLEFQPNTTIYSVDPSSDIGQKIASSKVGVVLHAYIDLEGNKDKVDTTKFLPGDLLVLPPVTLTNSPDVDNSQLEKLQAILNKNANNIDSLLNVPAELKMSDFDNILYTYINSSVKSGTLNNLGRQDFVKWVQGSNLSNPKKEKSTKWAETNAAGFDSMFKFIIAIKTVKNNIIGQLDNQPADIEAYTDGKRGGEGYVVGKDVKLVNRAGFTAANAARNNN